VWEWCSDEFQPYTSAPSTFLSRLVRRRFRVIRGGGMRGSASYARVSNRYHFVEWRKEPTVGFRLAM
jgi:formylglycine-generating enzyme required for sulfatase activity